MHPLEPQEPKQAIKLSTLQGTLVCLALPLLGWGLFLLLELPNQTGNIISPLLHSLWLFGAAAFVVRLFQWCDSDHLLMAAMALLILVFLSLFGLSPHRPFLACAVSFLTSLGLLITGAIGMAIGGFVSRRTADAKRSSLIRSVLAATILGLVLGPSFFGFGTTSLSVLKAERAGAASLKANANALARTVITPTLDAPLSGGTNVIWCGTMQLAWNEFLALAGEAVRMENQDPAVDSLNRATLAKSDLDPDTYVVAAAPSTDRALRDLRARVNKAFKGAVTPELIPDPASLPPNAFVLYAALFVNLPFDKAFKRLEDPFLFGNEKVAAFGTKGLFGDPHQENKIRAQVSLCDYRDADDFVVALSTKRTAHQLILAKVPPSATLADTARSVLSRVPAQPAGSSSAYKHLVVPITDYDLSRSYPELVGRPLTVKNPLFHGMPIIAAVQSIRFKLDERGALLRSEALALAECKSASRNDEPPDLIFDKPFLVLLKLTTSDTPYFAMWVSNAEILTPFSTKAPASN